MSKVKKSKLKRLQDCWLYKIASKKDLAYRLSHKGKVFTQDELETLAYDEGNFNVYPKLVNGKIRIIEQPKTLLQILHRRVHELLARIETPEYLHSTIKGRSYLTNANAHSADEKLIKIDIKKFYQSVSKGAVYRFFFEEMECTSQVAGLLADLLTYGNHLPTGSSASPILSYYVCKNMFNSIHSLCHENGLVFTCYVDDMTISGQKANGDIINQVREIVSSAFLRTHKIRKYQGTQSKVITGVAKTANGNKLPFKNNLKIVKSFGMLRNESGVFLNDLKLKNQLLGQLVSASQIEPTQFKGKLSSFKGEICKQSTQI